MQKIRFTEPQIIGVLRQAETGKRVEDVCLEHGISQSTFHRWQSKYCGSGMSDADRLETLEAENRRLKRLVEVALDNRTLGALLARKW